MKRQRNDGLRKICKCSLRKWARCGHPWYFSHKPKGGARVRVSIDRYAGRHVAAIEEAKDVAAQLRTAIKDGTYPPKEQPGGDAPAIVTFEQAAERFLAAVPVLRGKNQGQPRGKNDQQMVAILCAWTPPGAAAPLGQHSPAAVTEDVLEAFVAGLREQGRAASTVSKYIQTIKALDRWMTKKRYRPASALSGESTTLQRTKGARRDRRLVPDTVDDKGKVTAEGEERHLLAAASPWLQRLILAALETGCRCGELLALTWGDVNLTRGEIVIHGATTKTGTSRQVPISPKLRAVLELSRLDPAGSERPRTHHVFGDAVGGRTKSIKKAWETAVLKATGHEPAWTASHALTAESRAALRAANLHFHDLRHEAGSRMLEAGWPLHHVQHMLGHADVKQTATYLNAERVGLHDSMKRFGTTPAWQSVAKAADAEQPPSSHDDQTSQPQPTIN